MDEIKVGSIVRLQFLEKEDFEEEYFLLRIQAIRVAPSETVFYVDTPASMKPWLVDNKKEDIEFNFSKTRATGDYKNLQGFDVSVEIES